MQQQAHRMLQKWIFSISAVATAFFLCAVVVYARTPIAPPTGFVNDRAGIFTPAYRQELERELADYDKQTSNQIVILAVPAIPDGSIEEYSAAVFAQWGIGKKESDNGLLLVIGRDDHKLRIEVGYGLEPYVTDSRAGDIIRGDIAPEFQKGNYDAGVKAAVAHIEEDLAGAPASPDVAAPSPFDGIPSGAIVFIFFVFQFVFGGLLHLMARSKSIVLGGVLGAILGGGVGWLSGIGFPLGIIPVVLFGSFGLLFDFIVSRHSDYRVRSGSSPLWWYSGSDSSGSGGSSFGGFGGGSSGGGGASGGW